MKFVGRHMTSYWWAVMLIQRGMVLALMLAAATFSVVLHAQHRKPRVEVELRVLHREPPPTLGELLSRIDLAAYVNVLSSQPSPRRAILPW